MAYLVLKNKLSHNISLVIKIQPDRNLERKPNLGSWYPLESQKNVVQIHQIHTNHQIHQTHSKSRSQTHQIHIQIHINHHRRRRRRRRRRRTTTTTTRSNQE